MLRALFFVICSLALLVVHRAPAVAEQELTIGSPAPSLDIEHWIQDGNGFFKPVKKFKKDKVYVVEFWATWCGPCIMSMPHLAETQKKYRGRGVQIISISDESLDEVESLLSQEHPQAGKGKGAPAAGSTFADITSAYCLTTDPDRSVHESYMEAANQNGIPTSFIVGKSGQVEWIGHPMEMDAPLEAVVEDTWDRVKFKKQFQSAAEFETNMQKLSMLAGAGKFDDAIAFAEAQIKKSKADELDEMVIQWTDIRFSLMISTGNITDDVVTYYRDHINTMKDNPIQLAQFGYSLYDAFQQGGDLGPLDTDVIKAITASSDKAPADAVPFLQNTIAQLFAADGQLEKAIEAQKKAVDAADERQKRRLVPFLESLQGKLAKEKKARDDK
ncbi:TlpA disulfide reductase family protein [Planctomycetes bacterium K23_9]|uniref:Thiol-disulfide oxidoreductase ResA n=1 Tax=Stieleria marina TaxID=1930275 RepID=A0A517P1N6_9BACT|nr:Thiol-disulfide oxidoreductase ResA [Planctomycetes bacterium K23_9]